MSATSNSIVFAVSLVAVTLLATAAETSFQLPSETVRLKPGSSLGLVNANCLLCHSADYISTQPRLDAAQWRAAVLKMQTKYGAPVATNNVDALVAYLTMNYGNRTNAPPQVK